MEKPEELTFLSTLLPLSVILFIIVLGVLLLNQQFNKKLFRQKLEGEQLKIRHQQELLRSTIQVQEDERRRIARNLHDELGAALSMTRMRLMQLEQRTDDPVLVENELKAVREMTEVALASMRRISHEILPPQLEAFGLVKTLDVTASTLNNLHGLEMTVEAPGDMLRLPLSIELGLYRVSMELINNTLKHAAASEIGIRISISRDELTLQYTDNGKGFPDAIVHEGLGHRNTEARIHSLGGTVQLENGTSAGIAAVIRIPLLP